MASVPHIMRNGGQWFLDIGKPNNGGPKVFSVSGHVNKPGNYEVPLGTPFSELLEMAGGVRKGNKLKGVIPGGSSMPILPAEVMMEMTMDFDALAKAGSGLGSGAVIVMDETTCMVKACTRISRFYHMESCGQCTPCREGTTWVYRILSRIVAGAGSPSDLETLKGLAENMSGTSICALCEGAAMPLRSFIEKYPEEFEYYVTHKRSLVEDRQKDSVPV